MNPTTSTARAPALLVALFACCAGFAGACDSPAPAVTILEIPGTPEESFDSTWRLSSDGSTVIGATVDWTVAYPGGFSAIRWTPSRGREALGDETGMRPVLVSADGSVIVGTRTSLEDAELWNGQRNAFRWTRRGGLRLLDPLGPWGRITGLSADGNVFAGTRVDDDGTQHAFVWENGRLRQIGWGSETSGMALGISADGRVVVGCSQPAPSSPGHAFLWNCRSGMKDLGTLDDGDTVADLASADGSVVAGWALMPDGSTRAFRWTRQRGMRPLETPGVGNFAASFTSADGDVLVGGGQWIGDASAGDVAVWCPFRWTAARGLENLGSLAGGDSFANAISSDGSLVVGASYDAAYSSYPFIWDRDHGMQELNGLLSGLGADMTGWALTSVEAVARRGRSVVLLATGTHDAAWGRACYITITPRENRRGKACECPW